MMRCFVFGICLLLSACGISAAERNNTANALIHQGANEAALQQYQVAQVTEPDNAILYFNASAAYLRTDRFDEAEEALQQAILRGDDNLASVAYYNLGNLHFMLGDYEAAIQSYRDALRLNPQNEDARYNLELANASRIEPTPTEIEMQTNPEQQQANSSATPTPDPSGQINATPTPTPTPPDFLPPPGPSPIHEGEDLIGDESSENPSTPVPRDGELTIEDADRLLEPVDANQERISTFRDNYNLQGTPQSGKDW